jgi:thiol-disulfide isomerase/thioredoxin
LAADLQGWLRSDVPCRLGPPPGGRTPESKDVWTGDVRGFGTCREVILITVQIRLAISLVRLVGTVAAVAPAQGPVPVTVFTGVLLGADGQPMKLAHARLLRAHGRSAVAETVVGPLGRFALAATGTGAFYLDFTGVNHVRTTVPVVLQRSATIDLDVRLQRHPYTDSLDRVTAIGDWNHFDPRTGRPLVKQSDGRYTLDVETTADTVAYQLLNLTPDRSSNGTDGIWYTYDGGGDYRSVIRADHGRATIVLDPHTLNRRPSEPRVAFGVRSSFPARLYELASRLDRWQRSYLDSSRAVGSTTGSVRFNFAQVVKQITKQLLRERDSTLRQILFCARLEWAKRGGPLDSTLAAGILREVRPSSFAWSFREFGDPSDMVLAYARMTDARMSYDDATRDSAAVRATIAYLDSVATRHPDPAVQADALSSASLLAAEAQLRDRANDYYARLVAKHPQAPLLPVLRSRFAADRVWRVGATVPDFRLSSLTDSMAVYTRDDMSGKVYLLEFWATWCKPCVDDMPYLHKAYDSFHGSGLEILSVSLDGDPADVTTFRAGRWSMPWLHAFARAGFHDPQVRRLEITFLPRRALVDRNGTILAVDEDLRGEKLKETLRRVVP